MSDIEELLCIEGSFQEEEYNMIFQVAADNEKTITCKYNTENVHGSSRPNRKKGEIMKKLPWHFLWPWLYVYFASPQNICLERYYDI